MEMYLVGGAVRDRLLGLPVHDKDWVVVGATPEQMLAAGYRPVGKDFPVFLHPKTHEEVALARTERKTGKGYKGFAFYTAPSVTLKEDLARRDLTINAIAEDVQGNLIDPYHGQKDLQDKVLRHVTEAFAEDPVRILRVARFAARYPDFSVAPETMLLMRKMVSNGEADALVAERVWQELAKGFVETKPSRLFEVLDACGALARILPEVALNAAFLSMLDESLGDETSNSVRISIRFALLAYAVPDPDQLTVFCRRLRVPSDCTALLLLVSREKKLLRMVSGMVASDAFELLCRSDAIRQPERFENLLQTAFIAMVHQGMGRHEAEQQKQRLMQALEVVLNVQTAPLAQEALRQGLQGAQIGQLISQARLRALIQVW